MAIDSLNTAEDTVTPTADEHVKYKSSGEWDWGVSEGLLNGVINKVRLSGSLYGVGSLMNESGFYAAATVKYDSNGVRQWVSPGVYLIKGIAAEGVLTSKLIVR